MLSIFFPKASIDHTVITNTMSISASAIKTNMEGSRRDICVSVNDLGRALYEEYAQRILRTHFSPMFRDLDQLTPEARDHVRDALQDAMRGSD